MEHISGYLKFDDLLNVLRFMKNLIFVYIGYLFWPPFMRQGTMSPAGLVASKFWNSV